MTSSPPRSSPHLGPVLPDLLLLTVHLAVAAGFIRLYDGAFFGDLAIFAVTAAASAFITRRLDLPTPVVVLVPAVGAVLVSTWVLFPDTTSWGLPTGATWDTARTALEEARAGMEVVTAPSEVLVGFQLVAGLALWSSVWFADWAAFRLRTPVEAIVPASVIFLFGAVLGSGEHQIWTTTAFATSCLLFVAAHRATEARVDRAWIASTNAQGSWALLRVGAGLTLVGMAAGVVFGPIVPGSGSDPVVSWREGSDGPRDRVALSPIVDLRRRLVDQTDVRLFTVTADRPAYWRTTALDQFDGELWTSGGTYRETDRSLDSPHDSGSLASWTSVQTYQIDVLGSIFLPAAFEPRALEESTHPLRWDPESSTLIVDSDIESVDGVRYRIESAIPAPSADSLRSAQGPDPVEVQEKFEALPPDLPPEVAGLALEVTGEASNRYEQALALQNWFRSEFEYTTEIPAGHDGDALSAFLRDRAGYCEQFAGTFAAMARSLGIPARVAIGFTPGEPDPDQPDTFVVRGRHAHAWPEVWFPDVGWVAFEPTPGRGLPDGQAYTGVPPQQDDGQQSQAPPPVATTTTSPARPGATTTTTSTTVPALPADDTEPDDRDDPRAGFPGWLPWVGGGGILAAVWIGLALWLPERRRRRMVDAEPAPAILASWREGARAVARLTGDRRLPHETHQDLARRVGPGLEQLGLREPFGQLAALATTAAWNPTALGTDQRDRAVTLTAQLDRETAEREPGLRRLVHRLSWRTIWGRD